MLTKKISFIVFCTLFISVSFFADSLAQKQVYGIVKNGKGENLVNVGVSLKNDQGYVIRFKQSNLNGRYEILLPDTPAVNKLWIEVSILGYKRIKQQLEQGKQSYNFIMEDESIELKEVKITKKPQIITIGDTLSYDVASFSRPEDRSIGDVIRRLPGISVAENGQISYNGKSISNLFIHGDDLMDGRYGMATKVITKEMIKSVDVMQHHQPIKVLKDKVFTDDVAINLVLKDENSLKLAGQAMVGGGLPKQFDWALNTITLNKKFKMLNLMQANNSGVDYQNGIAQLGNSGLVSNTNNTKVPTLLSNGTVGNPDIQKRNYYLNKSGLFNANNLYNFKSGLQLKTNIQVLKDRNTTNFNQNTDNYLFGDTIRFKEGQNIINRPFEFQTALNAMVNKNSYFFNNKFSFNFSEGNHRSNINFNNQLFNQNLSTKAYSFSNDFSFTPALKGKNILDVRWFLNSYDKPQNLDIFAGLNQDVLNQGIPYAAAGQYANVSSFFSSATIEYRLNNNHLIKQSYQIGLLNEHQKLNSDLKLTQNDGAVTSYKGDVGNNLTWNRDRFMANANYYIKKKVFEARLSIPLIAQSIRYKQEEYQINNKNQQLFLNPNLNIKLLVNAEDYVTVNYSFNNSTGAINNVYRSVILTNYRSINANAAALQEQYSSSSSLFYNFQRSIQMLFINAGISYNKVNSNSILSTQLTDQIQRTVLLPYKNDQSVLSANVGISKYLFGLNSTISLKSTFNNALYNQFVNNQELPFLNKSYSLNGNIESNFFGELTFSYTGTALWNASKQNVLQNLGVKLETKSQRFDQNISLGYSPINHLYLNLQGRHIYAKQASISTINYLFVDTKLRYKILKWRTDLEFDITNIANIKSYETISLSSNQFVFTSYEIRGRMAILRATFNL